MDIRPDLREALAAATAYAASAGADVPAELVARLAVKTVADVLDEFTVKLSESVVAVFNGEASAKELASDMRTAIRVYGRMAYTQGMTEGGIDNPEAEISDSDEYAIDVWIAGQLEHVAGFASDCALTRKAEDRGAAQAAMLARFDQWVASLRDIGSQGKASALKDTMVTWRLGATEDHCPTCNRLHGKRHRLSWFMQRDYRPQENGSTTLACEGWNCDCSLVSDSGDVIYPA